MKLERMVVWGATGAGTGFASWLFGSRGLERRKEMMDSAGAVYAKLNPQDSDISLSDKRSILYDIGRRDDTQYSYEGNLANERIISPEQQAHQEYMQRLLEATREVTGDDDPFRHMEFLHGATWDNLLVAGLTGMIAAVALLRAVWTDNEDRYR